MVTIKTAIEELKAKTKEVVMLSNAISKYDTINTRLENNEELETILNDVFETYDIYENDSDYIDFSNELFCATYLIKENRLGKVIDLWKTNKDNEIIGVDKIRID